MKKAKKKPVKYQSGGAVKKKLPKDAIHQEMLIQEELTRRSIRNKRAKLAEKRKTEAISSLKEKGKRQRARISNSTKR